jgi:hypothetical protein
LRLAPGWPSWPPRLRPLPLRFSLAEGLKPEPSLEGGFEEFLELRPFCSSSWATRLISCSNSARTAGGVASQSEPLTPASGGNISGCLMLRSKRLPGFCQGRGVWSSHPPLNSYQFSLATAAMAIPGLEAVPTPMKVY